MKLQRLLAAIAVISLVMGSVITAHAGTDDKLPQKTGKRAATLKKGDTEQGTFAYRYDTFTNYSSTNECNYSSTTCTSGLNSSLSNVGAYTPPMVKPMDKKDGTSTMKTEKAETPTND
jgi:hypothetical protein